VTTLAESLVASFSRKLTLRMRSDLTAKKQLYHGRSYWVVKEPLGLKYFRFQEEEYAILQMLDGQSSLEDIKKRFERDFSPQKITYQELQDFIGMLHRSGLVVSNELGQGAQLRKRGAERKRKETLAMLTNVLAIRYKGIDPEWLLARMYPYVAWFFSRAMFYFIIVLATAALTLVLVQFDVFRTRLPAFHEFFGPKNWLLLGLVLAVTKVLHEFGHGLSCKHFGGECHEMGVMLLVLTPCLYCNVSDSWMLPNKWHRAAIGAAGMYVEAILASIATFIWWFTDPGVLNHVCLRVMFICSVSTLMFNGNPLLRFDGYYILSDITEIPNLRQKSSSVMNHYLCKWCLGMDMPEDPFMPKRNQAFFMMYTVAAVMYRWFIVIAILMMLNRVFEPYGLKILGQMVAVAALGGMVGQPGYKLWKFFTVPGRTNQIKMHRLYITLAIVLLAIAAVGALPVPHHVACSVEIRPRDAEAVYVNVPGRLDALSIEPGATVKKDDELARLKNVDLQMEIDQLVGEELETQRKLDSLRRQRFTDPQAGLEVAATEKMLAMIREQLAEKQRDQDKLTLRAPIDGTVFPPPYRSGGPDTGLQLPGWTGTPFDDENQQVQLVVSDMFCQIGQPRQLDAMLVIGEGDVEMVRVGQPVRIKMEAYAGETFRGEVENIAPEEMKAAPGSLSTQSGGSLATQTDESGVQRPQDTSYQANVPLDDEQGLLRLGMRGRAKVYVGNQPLAYRIWRYLAHTFHFQL